MFFSNSFIFSVFKIQDYTAFMHTFRKKVEVPKFINLVFMNYIYFSKVALKNKRRRENAKKRQEESAANPLPTGAATPAAQQNGGTAKLQSNGNKGTVIHFFQELDIEI